MATLIEKIIRDIKATKLLGSMSTKVISIDGPGGAGKSKFAEALSEKLGGVQIIHTDDFVDWDNLSQYNSRLIQQVLEPLSKNVPGKYQCANWDTRTLSEWHDVPLADFLIVEGVHASMKMYRSYVTYHIWINTPRDERLRRGLKRDGEDALKQWEGWMSMEDAYIEAEHPDTTADIIVDGTDPQFR